MNRVTSLLPYFGGKSKIAHLYPEPVSNTIMEAFCGGASYSLRYADRTVWLNDLNPDTAAIWKFLTSKTAWSFVRTRVPITMEPGETLKDFIHRGDPPGFVALLRSQFAQGSFGMKGKRTKVSPFGAQAWKTFRQRLQYWIPRIAHWKVTSLDYRKLPNIQATWLIDPPYNNAAGKTYAKSAKGIDYAHLGKWCQTRKGQVIVCENIGADWLPFRRLTSDEAVYTRMNGRLSREQPRGGLSPDLKTRLTRSQKRIHWFVGLLDDTRPPSYSDEFFFHLNFVKQYPKAVAALLKQSKQPATLRELLERA